MKRYLRLAGILAGVAAAAWLVKDRLLPDPSTSATPAPPFRSPDAAPADRQPAATERTPRDGVPGEDLTDIKGIGPVYATKLTEAGITSFSALAAANASDLATRIEVTEDQAASWIKQAQER